MSRNQKKATIQLFEEELFEEEKYRAATTHYPSPISPDKPQMSDEEKISCIAENFRQIMEVLGLDLNDDSLSKTPYRIAKMYVKEIFSGLDVDQFPTFTFMENRYKHKDRSNMVFVTAQFTSFCEHHFVPMCGTAYVAYLPNQKLIGLSKIPRLVKYFAKRPQVQERLTIQIADSLSNLLETEDVAVSITAQHFCVVARGIENQNSTTTTHVFQGGFRENDLLREEFFESVKR
ncbi:MAG: GTP cyclohydrolase I FolE [Waddliaceae bacterium]